MKTTLALFSVLLLLFAGSMALAANDGETIYKSCAACHGKDGSKPAGGSSPLKGQSAEETLKKLEGYAAGTYGGAQKTLMVNITKKHSAEDLKAVADYIATFK